MRIAFYERQQVIYGNKLRAAFLRQLDSAITKILLSILSYLAVVFLPELVTLVARYILSPYTGINLVVKIAWDLPSVHDTWIWYLMIAICFVALLWSSLIALQRLVNLLTRVHGRVEVRIGYPVGIQVTYPNAQEAPLEDQR